MKADSVYVLKLGLMGTLVECYGLQARNVNSLYGENISTLNIAVLEH